MVDPIDKNDLVAAVIKETEILFEIRDNKVYDSTTVREEVTAAVHSVLQPAVGKEVTFLHDGGITVGTLTEYEVGEVSYNPEKEALEMSTSLRLDVGLDNIVIEFVGPDGSDD